MSRGARAPRQASRAADGRGSAGAPLGIRYVARRVAATLRRIRSTPTPPPMQRASRPGHRSCDGARAGSGIDRSRSTRGPRLNRRINGAR